VIPLVLIAGFLGAGKTRFLTDVIPLLYARGIRVRVVLNDFENADVDAARLSALDALVTPLNGECVCCGSLRELMDTLRAVPADPGSVMLIEANGATQADELLGHLTTDRRLSQFALPLQLTVIDAGRWQKRWWHNALEAAQTRTATHIQLNWTARLSPTRLRAVEEKVRTVAPHADFTTPTRFADAMAKLSSELRETVDRGSAIATSAATEHASEMAHPQLTSHQSASHQATSHLHPFASASLPLPHVVARDAFLQFVRSLPPEVIRAKGLVRFDDKPNQMFVWNRVDGRKGVSLDPSSPHADAQPLALFIGVHLPIAILDAMIIGLSGP